jgi:hypothetical protein
MIVLDCQRAIGPLMPTQAASAAAKCNPNAADAGCWAPHLDEVVGVICRVLCGQPQLCTAPQGSPPCMWWQYSASAPAGYIMQLACSRMASTDKHKLRDQKYKLQQSTTTALL